MHKIWISVDLFKLNFNIDLYPYDLCSVLCESSVKPTNLGTNRNLVISSCFPSLYRVLMVIQFSIDQFNSVLIIRATTTIASTANPQRFKSQREYAGQSQLFLSLDSFVRSIVC